MENKIEDIIDKLDERQVSELLEKDINFEIDKKTISRIRASVHKKAKINKKPLFFSRGFIACATAAVLIFGTMFALGIDRVAAVVQHAIEYIPGFGRVPENISGVSQDAGGDMAEVEVMKEPVFIEVQGEKVEVYSSWLSINKDQAIVTTILHYPQNIELNGEIFLEYNGKKIFRDGEFPDFSSPSDNKKYKEMTYTYTIKNPKFPIDALTFKTENSEVQVAFKKSEDLKDKVISQNFNGIIVSAIPLNEDRSKFILTSTYEKNMEGVMFISSLAFEDNLIKAVDETGKEYAVRKATSQGSEYYVDGDIKGKVVALKFSKLYQGFIYEKNKSIQGIKFKVPKINEKVNINKSMDNPLSSITLKTVERSEASSNGSCNLIFTFEMKNKVPGLDIDNMSFYVEKTGGVISGKPLEKYKEGDNYVIKYGVLADENASDNIVSIFPYGSYYWNTLLLDKECVLKFQ